MTFKLKSEGDKVTGTITTPRGETPIENGKTSGDDISFVQNLTFGDRSIKFNYTGKVAGSEIKFKREIEGGQGPPPQEFTAKKK
jgi:hypothetical protein